MPTNSLKSVEREIYRLERKVDEARDIARKWNKKYKNLKAQYDVLQKKVTNEENSINPSEFEQLKVQNSKLMLEISRLKREERTASKILKDVEHVLKINNRI